MHLKSRVLREKRRVFSLASLLWIFPWLHGKMPGALSMGLLVTNAKNIPMAPARSGGNHNGQASNDSYLPGLPDDMALDILAWCSRADYPILACLNKKFNSLIASGSLYKLRQQLGILEYWVFLACILMPWEAYDPSRQAWASLSGIPCDNCFDFADKESLAVGTQLLVFGRELAGNTIWIYSLVTRKWLRGRSMNMPRCLFASSSHGEVAIVAGGSDINGRILKSAELYDSKECSWNILPDMNIPRKLCSGFFMDGKFYVIGGLTSLTRRLTCAEEYDIEKKTWRRIEKMHTISKGSKDPASCSPPLVAVVNNQLYAVDQSTNEVKRYDKMTHSWSVVKRMPIRVDSSYGWGVGFKACGSRLLVVGGHRDCNDEVVVVHSLEPEYGNQDWKVLSVKDGIGAFVCNCAIMGC